MAFAIEDLKGSIPPLVTPFRNGEVDYAAYASLLEGVVAGRSHGVLVNGTTAEPTTLTLSERTSLVKCAVEKVAGRVPVVAATGAQSFKDTLQLTREATSAGADALLILTPYFIKPPARGMIEYFKALASETPLPILIYHIPGRSGTTMPAAAVAELSAVAPSVVGVKHASTDLAFVTELLTLKPDCRIFAGLEDLSFPMMAVGAVGVMNAAGNVVPLRIAALAEAALSGDMARASTLHLELFKLNQAIFWDTNPIPLKYMLKRMELLPDNEHRLPMCPPTTAVARRIDQLLDEMGLLRGRRAA
jgi:4-hydroxy-tetrahydrodipicolinate synthase